MTGLINTFGTMSLVTASLLALLYLFVAQSSRIGRSRFSIRPALVASGWLLLAVYLVVEVSFDWRSVNIGVEALSLASLVLFTFAAMPPRRSLIILSTAIVVSILLLSVVSLYLPGSLLGIFSCVQMAFGFHRVLPMEHSRRLYLIAKTSILFYLLMGSVYPVFSSLDPTHYSDIFGSLFIFTFLAKLIHIAALTLLLLAWMGRRGAEAESIAAVARQRQFIAEVAHELKTPIAELKLRLSSLRTRSQDAAFATEANSIVNAAERIAAIVGGSWRFLTNPETKASSIAQEEIVDIASLIETAYLSMRSTTSNPGRISITRSYSAEARVRCRPPEIVQLFLNLLLNAVESFSPEGGRIKITTARTRNRGGDFVTVDLEDSGKGIPPADAAAVFDAGFTTKAGSGRGYGLTVARRIAEAHGGTLEVFAQEQFQSGGNLRLRLPALPLPRQHQREGS